MIGDIVGGGAESLRRLSEIWALGHVDKQSTKLSGRGNQFAFFFFFFLGKEGSWVSSLTKSCPFAEIFSEHKPPQ